MIISSTIRVALRAIVQNKMRSALTMLGIVIGVGAVVAMIAIGEGARISLDKEIASLGTNILRVSPGAGHFGGIRTGPGELTTLVEDDAAAIKSEIEEVVAAAPIVRGTGQVIFGNSNWSSSIIGSTGEFGVARDWKAADGRFFSGQEEDGGAKVCLIGKTIRDNLFFDEDPIGKMVRINRVPFLVIGVLEEKGQSPIGRDQDDLVLVPLRTAQRKIFGITYINDMWVKVRNAEVLAPVSERIQGLIRQRHRIQEGEEDDFTVRNLSEILSRAAEANRIMSILLGSVAAVSLLVGGIGIMNIMLVSVTERTREIGIRMAVGAKERDILLQFITEAVVLSVLGGIAGILLGMAATRGLTYFAGWDTYISGGSILLAFGFSAAVGIFFGIYPAKKASRLDPIDALRYE